MVSFHDNPEKYNNPAMLHKIDQEVKIADKHESIWQFQISLIFSSLSVFCADVKMYRAGWETKVYGSRDHSKPTICAKGEEIFNRIKHV